MPLSGSQFGSVVTVDSRSAVCGRACLKYVGVDVWGFSVAGGPVRSSFRSIVLRVCIETVDGICVVENLRSSNRGALFKGTTNVPIP